MVKLPTVDRVISLVRKPGQPVPAAVVSKARESRLRGAFDNAPVGIALASMHGTWLETNERFRELIGYTREELVRMTFADLTHPDDARVEERQMRRLLAGEVPGYRIEKRIMGKKGRYRELEVTCAISGSDDAPFLIYVVDHRSHTVPERHAETPSHARTASQNAEQLLLAVIDQLPDIAIIRTDDRGLIAGWNAGAERILGYQRDEIIGRPRRMLYRDNEGWAGVSTQQLNAVAASGSLDLEDWRVRKDGSHVWVHTSINGVRVAGSVKGFVEVIRAPERPESLTAATKQSLELLQAELHKRDRIEDSLRSAVEELRLTGEQTMDELKIMTDALRKELERRKRAEEELRAIHQHASRAVVLPLAPAESEIVSTSMPAARKWRSLGDGNPAELLVKHISQERTGRLVVASGPREKELFIDKGKIISCSSNDPSRFLAQRLIGSGLISEEQRQKALEIQSETRLALGRILVILGALTENQLHDAMRSKAEEEIAELCGWRDAKFVFVEEEIPTLQLVPLRIDAAELLVHQVVQQIDHRAAPVPATSNGLKAIDVARIVDDAVTDLVIDDIASAADEIAFNIEALSSKAEILIASATGKTKRFHRASCGSAKRLADETRVVFMSAQEATTAGYDACRMCFRDW
ncbi:MAG TPA: PAS domain S-box protein [Thermoanaerobaculia bacterium]|jgi:PAS domain S-box-containing protein|nr:PAS domain S-box protein [Thermoanaerobaculia bacterium]